MIANLRAMFLSRLLREKILLLGFILIGTLWWGSAFLGRGAAFWRQQRSTTATLAEQQQWLDNRGAIETAARNAANKLVAANTLDRTRLLSAVTQAAADAGLTTNTSSNPAASETNGQFTVHSLDHRATNVADYVALEKFYLNLHRRAPYLGIERFALSVSPDRTKHTLELRISSVEIPR